MSDESKKEELLQFVSFKLDNEEFCINIFQVREINKFVKLTKVPNSPPFVEGVINLRGKIIPVINLRSKFGKPEIADNNNTRIVVVDLNDQLIGLKVDEVSEVLRIPGNVLEEPPNLVRGIEGEYITAIAKLEDRLLIHLDLDILTKNEINLLEEVI